MANPVRLNLDSMSSRKSAKLVGSKEINNVDDIREFLRDVKKFTITIPFHFFSNVKTKRGLECITLVDNNDINNLVYLLNYLVGFVNIECDRCFIVMPNNFGMGNGYIIRDLSSFPSQFVEQLNSFSELIPYRTREVNSVLDSNNTVVDNAMILVNKTTVSDPFIYSYISKNLTKVKETVSTINITAVIVDHPDEVDYIKNQFMELLNLYLHPSIEKNVLFVDSRLLDTIQPTH